MEFTQFNQILTEHVSRFTGGHRHLFVADVEPDALWELYLESFPPEMNPVFRERREFDCSCCRQFVRAVGNVVAINGDNELVSLWDFSVDHAGYQQVLDALSSFVRAAPVRDVFVSPTRRYGTEKNVEIGDDGTSTHVWHHLCAEFSSSVKVFGASEEATVRGQLRDSRNVMERSFREIGLDALDTVLELIAQRSLYKGEEWASVLAKFRGFHKTYGELESESQQANYCWVTSLEAGPAVSRIKNHSIGVLLTDISTGVELDDAVRRYERIVAPSNYKRPKAIFTKAMVQRAQQKVQEMGFENSLGRRHARLGDITVNNILWANRDVARKMAGDDVFGELAASVSDERPKSFDRIEEVSIDTFVGDILPQLTELEVLVENKHASNMVSLIAPQDTSSPSMFKWPNGFTWAYSGNITDSMKQRVKAAGGKVDGDLRFSIQWNDFGDNPDDLDAHCHEPGGGILIYYSRMRSPRSGGTLDVDILDPKGKVAVENITWPDRSRMFQGKHLFLVHNFRARGAQSGFSAEIEFDGQLYSFDYPRPLRQGEKVNVAEVTLTGREFSIKPLLGRESSREVWGLPTQQFHPVSACMYSPNYWDGHTGTGHRHYFFVVKGCKSEETPNGFFNEFLSEELREHKRVFEALGSKMRVSDAEAADQLSGLGFSATKRGSVVVRAKGAFTRVMRLMF